MVKLQQTETMPYQDGGEQGPDWVSALLDGELDAAAAKRALGRLREDAGAAAAWRDYCRVSDTLHGDCTDSDRFMARFRAALEAEPTVLAPVAARASHAAPVLWTAAAAAMAAITWSVWTAAPTAGVVPSAASVQALASADARPAASRAANDAAAVDPHLQAYLAAHQDYAYAVVSMPDLVVERVSLADPAR